MKIQPSIAGAFAIIPRFDESGNEYSVVYKDESFEKYPFKSRMILDCHLRQNGSSYRGAKDAANFVLRSSSMFPIVTQLNPSIVVWFPSESPKNKTCVYFALDQISEFDHFGDNKTIVYNYSGIGVVVPVPISKFNRRIGSAKECMADFYKIQRRNPSLYVQAEEKLIIHCADLHEPYHLK